MGILRRALGSGWPGQQHGRVEYPDPLEGTRISLWPQVAGFWSDTFGVSSLSMSPAASEKVWVAQRCIQLNAQQIAGMPLEFHGSFEPAWLSNPDPAHFPNGISDAMFATVANLYRWGFSIGVVTSTYSSGFPQGWTVLDSAVVSIESEGGRKQYKVGDTLLDPARVFQIDRDPQPVGSSRLHGTSALSGYASQAWGVVSAGELARSYMSEGAPASFYLQSTRRLTTAQAQEVSDEWAAARASNAGRPPVVPPEIEPKELTLSPNDLLLIEGQEFSARVVASAFGVPAMLLNLPVQGGLTYQNPAMLGELWWRFELRPMAKRIADALTAQLLPRGNYVSFDASDTFAPIVPGSEDNDPQLSQSPPATANASPNGNGTRQLAAIGG